MINSYAYGLSVQVISDAIPKAVTIVYEEEYFDLNFIFFLQFNLEYKI